MCIPIFCQCHIGWDSPQKTQFRTDRERETKRNGHKLAAALARYTGDINGQKIAGETDRARRGERTKGQSVM